MREEIIGEIIGTPIFIRKESKKHDNKKI